MANFNNIKHEIDQNVNTNGVQAITGAILNETLKDMIDEVDDKKQDTLVAGSGIAINGNVISATGGGGASYSAGYGINISNNIISADINEVQDKLVSGQNIKTINGQDILGTGDIQIQGGATYTAGDGIDIDSNNVISVDASDLAGNGLQDNGNGGLEIDPSVVATQNDLSGYLPLEGGVLQQDSGVDTTLQVIDPDSEDYVKLVAPDAGDNPHIEIFENGSGDTKIYYDKIHSGNYDLNFPTLTQDETIATVSDLNTATSGLQPALTAGNGIEIDANNEISVKAGTGLGFDANGYLINTGGGGGGQTLSAGDGIEIDQNDAINVKLGDGLQLDSNNNIEIDSSVATRSDLSGYLPLIGGNLQALNTATEVRVKSPSDDSYVYLHAVDSGSPTIKFHNNIQNPTNGEVHEITLHNERLDIERWDQSGNTWMADTLYFPQFKTGTIALDSDLAGKQDTLTAGTGITIQNNVISATGGSGQSYTAGTGINIDSNNVISNTAPGLWTSGTGTNSLVSPASVNAGRDAAGAGAIMAGDGTSKATGSYSTVFGHNNSSTVGSYTLVSGSGNTITGNNSAAFGQGLRVRNDNEIAIGQYNSSNIYDPTHQWTTRFSVGNGSSSGNLSNAFEIRSNGKVLVNGVGGYTGSGTDNTSNSLQDVINGKQDQLTAGTGISIQNNVISATGGGGTTYTASSGIDISQNNEIAVSAGNGLTFNPNNAALEVDWTTIPIDNGLDYIPDPVDPSILRLGVDTSTIQEKLVAGSNITINGNVISASGGSGSGLWSSGTGTNSLLSPSAVASSATASGTGAINAGYFNGQSGYASFANGDYSANFGTNNKVSYANSFASGLGNTTGGHEAFVGGGASNNAHGDCSAVIGGTFGTANGDNSVVIASGANGTANGSHSVAIGNATASGYGAIAIGEESSTNANHAIAIAGANATGVNSVAIGKKVGTNNENEIGLGFANKVYTSGTGSIKSAFTVGNGTFSNGNYTYSNGLELKGNSDFYVYGVGGFDGTNSYNGNNSGNRAKTLQEVLNDKQDTLTAGTGISISGNVISATGGSGASYTAGAGITIDQNNEISVDNSYLQSQYLPLTGGNLQEDPNDNVQTNIYVYSPDSNAIGYISSYSEDTSDPQNPIPAFVELGLQGQSSGSADTTQGICLRSNGTIAVDYIVDSQGNTEMVELELPRKASGQTYTIATLDDIQGGGSYTAGNGIDITSGTISVDTGYLDGEYLPLTGGQLKANPSDAETLLDVAAPDSTSAISMSADTIDSKLAISADKANAGISDGDTFRTVLSNTGEIQVSAKTVNPLDPTDIGETTYTLVLPQKNDTIATLSDIQGGGSSYTAGTGINIDANNVISNTAPDPGVLIPGAGNKSLKLNAISTSADGSYSIALGAQSHADGAYSFAAGQWASASRSNSIALGDNASSSANYALAVGQFSSASGVGSVAIGQYGQAKNTDEIGLGKYNNSINTGTTAEKTQFTVGNGTANNARSNLIEAKQNNDIYVIGVGGFDGTNAGQSGVETLQDAIANAGGGGSSLWTSGSGTDSLLGPGSIGADGDYSIAAGEDSNAQANNSVALSGGVVVYDDSDPNSIINGEYGVAIGTGATVETASSLAMMGGTASSQNGGSHSVAIGDGATAEGMYDVALTGSSSGGNYSFAASTGIAVGHYSTGLSGGEGDGEGSLASGFGSVAYGYSSAALGLELMTYDQADGTLNSDPNAGEAAFGRYNYSEQNIIFSIGCGHYEPPVDPTDPADVGTRVRENAITITNDGKIYLKGLGGYTGTSVSGCTDLVSFLNNL